jgi:transposase, IS5 family
VRTYCRVARVYFVNFQKKRKKTKSMIRVARGKILRYLRRNIQQMEKLLKEHGKRLAAREREALRGRLEIIKTIYEQQHEMWKKKARSIKNRIVSLHLPHIRPVVRGKDGKAVEFGPKVMLSWTGRFAFLDKLSFEVYNEGLFLKESLEKYRERFKKDPRDSTGDGIFGTRANRGMLKEMKIRGGFKALGKAAKQRINRQWFRRKQAMRSSRMEGLIGNAKNHYGLDRIWYRVPGGEEMWTRNCLMAMNLVMALKIMTEVGTGVAKA